MAADYQVIGSYATVQVTGPQSAVDVLRITFRTAPSGVVAVANAPYKNLVGVRPGDVDAVAATFIAPLAAGIERMIGSGRVAGANAAEDTDASGLLIDYLDVVVEYAPTSATQGEFTQVVRIPVFFFDEPSMYGALVGDRINEAWAGLQALAAA